MIAHTHEIKPLSRSQAYPIELLRLVIPVLSYLTYINGYPVAATLMAVFLLIVGVFNAEVAIFSIATIRSQFKLLDLQSTMLANLGVEAVDVENKKKSV
jgi:hypothetical protein